MKMKIGKMQYEELVKMDAEYLNEAEYEEWSKTFSFEGKRCDFCGNQAVSCIPHKNGKNEYWCKDHRHYLFSEPDDSQEGQAKGENPFI